MRALPVQQPFAELIVSGDKDEEYRSRRTHIRERVYIYATNNRPNRDVEENIREQLDKDYGIELDIGNLPRGVLVGTVEIIDCTETEEGDYAWVLANPERLPKPQRPKHLPNGPNFFYPF